MRFAFSRIAMGMTFDLIDIRVLDFDLLPDVIGYLLIMWGSYRLWSENRFFLAAWAAAAIQLLPSCAALFGHRISVPLLGSERLAAPQLIEVALLIALEAAMLFGICAGIRTSALKRGPLKLAEAAQARWNALIAVDGTILLLLPFLLNVVRLNWFLLILALGCASLIVHIRVLFLVNRAGRELPEDDDGQETRMANEKTA